MLAQFRGLGSLPARGSSSQGVHIVGRSGGERATLGRRIVSGVVATATALAVVTMLGRMPVARALGTPKRVRDINTTTNGSSPEPPVVIHHVAYFQDNDGIHGSELWRSDGTAAGTRLVKDIRPGSLNGAPDVLTPVGETLFFIAEDGTHGLELWKSDGTASGTKQIRDI